MAVVAAAFAMIVMVAVVAIEVTVGIDADLLLAAMAVAGAGAAEVVLRLVARKAAAVVVALPLAVKKAVVAAAMAGVMIAGVAQDLALRGAADLPAIAGEAAEIAGMTEVAVSAMTTVGRATTDRATARALSCPRRCQA